MQSERAQLYLIDSAQSQQAIGQLHHLGQKILLTCHVFCTRNPSLWN